jgi:hypothetical protein
MFLSMGNKPSTAVLIFSMRVTYTVHYILFLSPHHEQLNSTIYEIPHYAICLSILTTKLGNALITLTRIWLTSHTCNNDTSDNKGNKSHAFIITVSHSSRFQSDAYSSPRPLLHGLIDFTITGSRPYRNFCATSAGRICANLWQSITFRGTLIHVLDRSIHHLTLIMNPSHIQAVFAKHFCAYCRISPQILSLYFVYRASFTVLVCTITNMMH